SREEQRQWHSFYPQGRVAVVKNPLATPPPSQLRSRQDLGVPDNVPIVLFVGRLIEVKGIGELIAALPAVLAHIPCHLVVAGEGAQSHALQRQALALGVAAHVTFTGY